MSGAEGTFVVADVRLSESGYRSVLLHLSALRFRFVVPVLALMVFGTVASQDAGVAYVSVYSFVGLLLIAFAYVEWQVRSPVNRAVYEPVHYEFGDTEITYEMPAEEGSIPWSAIVRWRFAAGHFVLHANWGAFLLVPEDSLVDGTAEELETLLRAHVARSPRGPVR